MIWFICIFTMVNKRYHTMYKIKDFRILNLNTTMFLVEGKKCAFEFQIQWIDDKYTYCVFNRNGNQQEMDKIINQLIEDNNLNDL